jgi:UDP-N-acetylmuramate--alanine ligase
MFEKLVNNTRGEVILNSDDGNLRQLKVNNAVTFSLSSPSDFRATDVTLMPFKTEFMLNDIRFRLQNPGRHNLLNALAGIAMLSSLGINPEDAAPHLANFRGIDRRFDVVMDSGHGLVIDDYAHNPHKIAALMETMRNIRDSICYIFQPHGYGPTRLMKDEYIDTFSKNLRQSDHLVLLPIYYAGGTANRDISSDTLAEGIAVSGGSVEVVKNRDAVLGRVGEWDNYVVFGARDETLSDFARDIASNRSRLFRNK